MKAAAPSTLARAAGYSVHADRVALAFYFLTPADVPSGAYDTRGDAWSAANRHRLTTTVGA